jgi:hypothetical protein
VSNIQNIYKDIANMKVGSVKSRNVDKVKLGVTKGQLPLRMLLPSTSGEMEFIAIGNLQNMRWAIRDLCLFAPLTKGSGVQQFSKAMVDYLDLYMKQIKDNRHPGTNANIVGVEVQMGPIPWGAEDYWAVDITLTVEEIL